MVAGLPAPVCAGPMAWAVARMLSYWGPALKRQRGLQGRAPQGGSFRARGAHSAELGTRSHSKHVATVTCYMVTGMAGFLPLHLLAAFLAFKS